LDWIVGVAMFLTRLTFLTSTVS